MTIRFLPKTHLIPLILATVISPPAAIAEAQEAPSPRADLRLETPAGLALVTAKVDGQPLRLLVDTGFDVSVIDAAAAASIGLEAEEPTMVPQPGGAVATGALPQLTVSFSTASFSIDTAQAMPLAPHFRSVGLEADGIIGHDVLAQAVFDFDYPSGRFRVWAERPALRSGSRPVAVEVLNSEPFVETTLRLDNRAPIVGRFKVDTGSTDVAGLNRNFAAKHRILNLPGSRSLRGLAAGGATEGQILRISGIEVAGFSLERPVIGITTDSGGFEDRADAGTIGAGILSRFRLVLDYPRGRIHLEPGPRVGVAPEADRAGAMLLAQPPDFTSVSIFQVIEGSPAADAGVRPGDRVISVDGEPLRASALIRVWDQLRDPTVERVEFELQRDGDPVKAHLTLRDDWLRPVGASSPEEAEGAKQAVQPAARRSD